MMTATSPYHQAAYKDMPALTCWTLSVFWMSWHSFSTMLSSCSGTRWQHVLRTLAISYIST